MKWMKVTCAVLFCSMLLASCGDASKISEDMKKTADDAAEKVKNEADKAGEAGKKTLDGIMQYLQENDIKITQAEKIDDIPFAAYDGRSVNINGSMVYLYRIDTEDESMKQIISQIKEDGTVYVEKDGQKQQYNGFVYQDYLLLYDRDTDMSAVVDVMNHYVPQTSPYYEEQ